MKPQISSGHRTRPPRLSAFARLNFAGLLAIIIATVVVREFARANGELISSPSVKPASAGRSHGFWYIRMDQWRADARTVVAAVRYVLEDECQSDQRRPDRRLLGLEVAMPTNSASVLPKA